MGTAEMMDKIAELVRDKRKANVCTIVRHELPDVRGSFTIDAYGYHPLSLILEDGIPILYEIAIVNEDDDRSWPHEFIWVETWEELPADLRQNSFIGTLMFSREKTMHLFQVHKGV